MLSVFPPKLSLEMPLAVSQLTPSPCTMATGKNHNHGLLPNTCSQFRRLPTSKGFSDKVFDGSRFSMCSIVVILCSVRSESDRCVSMLTATNKVQRLTNVKAGKTRENNGAQQHERKNDTNLKRLAGHLTARVRRSHARRLGAEGDAPVLGSHHQTSLTPGQRAC
jgi:hypothetical protein